MKDKIRIYDLLDSCVLQEHLNERRVSVQFHPTLPLLIYNYTQKAAFDPHWGDGTIDYCRGLIVNQDTHEIVSRPFKKFHNINTLSIPETMEENLPRIIPEVTKKYDGSLGIYYNLDGQEGIATRGSFTSDQAKWATSEWLEHYKDRVGSSYGWTPLFEIIYKQNRIVVDYDFEGLVLIGMVNKKTGEEMTPRQLRDAGRAIGVRTVEEVFATTEELKAANKNNEEGYVISYPVLGESPIKVKIKMADYVRLHRVVTGMNPRSIWELLRDGASFEKFNAGYPLPFVKWLNQWRDKLLWGFQNYFDDAYEVYNRRPVMEHWENEKTFRKRCALYFTNQPRQDLKGVFFMLMDGKDISEAIWDLIEPAGNDQTFRQEGE